MSRDGEAESKEFDPSPKRLQRAREEGEAIRSEELQAALAYLGLLIGLFAVGGHLVTWSAGFGLHFLYAADRLELEGEVLLPQALMMLMPVAALLMLPGLAVVLWLIASGGLTFAPQRLGFRPARISPLANAGQKFGRAGLIDFARRALKMGVISYVLFLYLRYCLDDLYESLGFEAGQITVLITYRLLGFLALIALLSFGFGLLDFIWQRAEFLRRNRMTRKEMLDETKESEGDPQLKADRRRRAEEVAGRQMIAEVPKADVVIVNPTHYAVALRWDRKTGRAPVCVAKGMDEMAVLIRQTAQAAGVPLRRDPPTARALYATVEIGHEIRREHYAAVAAAIRFSEAMRRKARGKRVF